MVIYGLWHGGSGYSYGDPDEDMEQFKSLKHAAEVLREREDNGGWHHMETFYVRRDRKSVLMPCVDGSSMDLFSTSTGGEPYARLVFGPRGGVRVENY